MKHSLLDSCDCDELFTLTEEIDDQVHAMTDEIKKIRSQLQRLLYFVEASPLLHQTQLRAKAKRDEGV